MSEEKQGALARIEQIKISAIVRTEDVTLAREAMKAAVAGGFRLIEFTLTTPGALGLISEFAADSDLLVGAGTVMSSEQARQSVEAGARFIVSPVCDPGVIAEGNRLGAATIPGAFTPTEMQFAHDAGADFVKLFPAPVDVAATVSSILGPLPHLKIFPTSGVDGDNFLDILRAGAVGVGFTKSLFVPTDMAERNCASIEKRAKEIVRRLEEHPG